MLSRLAAHGSRRWPGGRRRTRCRPGCRRGWRRRTGRSSRLGNTRNCRRRWSRESPPGRRPAGCALRRRAPRRCPRPHGRGWFPDACRRRCHGRSAGRCRRSPRRSAARWRRWAPAGAAPPRLPGGCRRCHGIPRLSWRSPGWGPASAGTAKAGRVEERLSSGPGRRPAGRWRWRPGRGSWRCCPGKPRRPAASRG
ncbi:Uncharacterised protein [Acinetobacter baumannii]|nr:Uncharacterised protein [Acinetobacter baumannii]